MRYFLPPDGFFPSVKTVHYLLVLFRSISVPSQPLNVSGLLSKQIKPTRAFNVWIFLSVFAHAWLSCQNALKMGVNESRGKYCLSSKFLRFLVICFRFWRVLFMFFSSGICKQSHLSVLIFENLVCIFLKRVVNCYLIIKFVIDKKKVQKSSVIMPESQS